MKSVFKIAALTLCVVFISPASESLGQSRERRPGNGRVRRASATESENNATTQPGANLPYRVEVGDGITPPGFIVTLAVGAFTVVRCPEPGLNLVFGNPADIEYQESVDGQRQYQLYLKPKRAGILMNVGIEMPSGFAAFYVRSVAVRGGARVGDFNGEVVIRPSGYRDELARAAARVAELERRAAEAEARAAAAEAGATERVALTRSDAGREALTAIEGVMAALRSRRSPVKAERGRVRIAQVGATARAQRILWALFAIENRNSRSLVLEDVRAEGARVALGNAGARQVAGRGSGRVAVRVEFEAEAPRQLTFVVNGANVTVPLAP